MYYIGIDLGTSAVKLLLVDEKGNVVNECSNDYPIFYPKEGWSEQNPQDWWNAVVKGIDELLAGYDRTGVKGIGCGGQMHGLVVLDKDDNVIRPAILWNDGRTAKEVEYLNDIVGKNVLSEETANIAFAGFTAPKILWMKNNEPEKFSMISKIMLPKDYIVYKLTGAHSCDYSDASGMLLLDVKNKKWSEKMIAICGISENMLPQLHESFDVVGTLSSFSADLLGLNDNVKVVAGAGDNAAAALGTCTIGNGKCNISLGTSGTVFISSDKFSVDPENSLHSFAHADGNYHLMGCMLSAASCNKWFMENILDSDDYSGIQSGIDDEMLGKNNVYFLPYLMGERSPINDTNARGTFIGLNAATTKEQMLLAVLEGVAFALKDSLEIARNQGIEIVSSTICGGGAKSPLWKKIISNVLGIRIDSVKTEQGPGYGGAILAMVGCGVFATVSDACNEFFELSESILPDKEISARYAEKYNNFKTIYPSLKSVFKNIYGN